jgi:hypothetical protein
MVVVTSFPKDLKFFSFPPLKNSLLPNHKTESISSRIICAAIQKNEGVISDRKNGEASNFGDIIDLTAVCVYLTLFIISGQSFSGSFNTSGSDSFEESSRENEDGEEEEIPSDSILPPSPIPPYSLVNQVGGNAENDNLILPIGNDANGNAFSLEETDVYCFFFFNFVLGDKYVSRNGI